MSGLPALVLVSSSFPILGDGSEAAGAFVADLAGEVSTLGIDVRVVAPGRARARETWCRGVEVFRYPSPEQPLSTLNPVSPLDAWRILSVVTEGQRATEAAVTRGAVRHIFALWALPCGHWARASARRHGLSYSVWTLGSDIWSLGRIPGIRSYLRRILRGASSRWSDGLELAEATQAIAGMQVGFLPSTRRITGKSIEPRKTVGPYRLLFLGRWHSNKGVDLLLDALQLLDESDWARIEAIEIHGGGPLDAQVRVGVQALQAAGRPVELGGFLGRDAAESAILRADWLLIPSRIESIPIIFSDAMKLGCPVVSTPVGDLPKLVAGRRPAGILAQAATAPEFAMAMSEALSRGGGAFCEGVASHKASFDLGSIAARVASLGSGAHHE